MALTRKLFGVGRIYEVRYEAGSGTVDSAGARATRDEAEALREQTKSRSEEVAEVAARQEHVSSAAAYQWRVCTVGEVSFGCPA